VVLGNGAEFLLPVSRALAADDSATAAHQQLSNRGLRGAGETVKHRWKEFQAKKPNTTHPPEDSEDVAP
jgi:hypothetical protein